MKKIFLALTILLCTQSFAEQKDRYGISAFAGLGNDAYVCDASDPKSNLRLDLVAAGFAVPTTDDSELLLKAAEEAKEAKRGMYSAKFYDITNCILNGVPMPKKDR